MNSGRTQIPARLIALDVIGTAFLVLGIAEHFADMALIPESIWKDYGIPFMVAGVALQVPLILFLVAKARGHSQ